MNITRKSFLAGMGAVVAVRETAFAKVAGHASPLRFLVASDIHYRPGVFPHDNRNWLERILARAEDARVAFAIQLGDFVHAAKRDSGYLAAWNGSRIPTHNVVGNHDDDGGVHQETLEAFHLTRGWYHFDIQGFRFIVLDTNYALIGDRYVHYGKEAGFVQWKLPPEARMRLHPDELDWLGEVIRDSSFPCIVCSHRRLDGDDADARAVRTIFSRANVAHPGRVVMAMNGHNHCDSWKVMDGVAYFTVNSANHHWVPRRHTAYPAEDVARWREIDHVVAYDTPLSAVVTLLPGGGINVNGMKGSFWRGIPPEKIGFSKGITAAIENRTILSASPGNGSQSEINGE